MRFAPLLLASLLAVLMGCSRNSPAAAVARADGFIQQGDFANAILEYRNGLRLAPADPDIALKLADALGRSGQPEKAGDMFERAADMRPDDDALQVRVARLMLNDGVFEAAQLRLRRVLARHPAHVEALTLYGASLVGLRQYDSALEQAEHAIQRIPAQAVLYAHLGGVQLARGETERAEATLRQAMALDRAAVEPRVTLALTVLSRGDSGQAETLLREARAAAPTHRVAARTLGSVLLAKGDVAGAESALLDWHKAMGQTPEAWLVLGDFHLATRQWDKANDAWRRVADPALAPSVAVRQARVLEAQGKPDDAETRLRSALAATPTHEEVLIALSQRLLARGQVPEGLTHAQTALRTHPLSAASATQLAEAMRAANDEFAAYELFKRAVLRDPQNVAALVGASSVARAIGDAESAVNYAREAVGVLPRAPEARLALAQAYRARGDLDAAGREILQVYSAAPTLPAVALEAAALLQQRGRHADARAVYDALLVSSPTSEEALAGVVSTYLAENQAARAIERLESRGLKRPDHPGWMRLRAAAAQGAGDTRLARSLLEAAIERDPDDYNTYVLLGTMLADQGALGEARRHFTTLVQRQPRPVGPWTMLGIVAEMGGDQAEAERCYRAAIAIDRKAAVASNNLAYLLAGRENQTGEALTLAETALARLPRRAEVVDTVGWVHLKAGTPRSAVSRFEQARQLAPGEPVYSYHAALAYEQLRDVERARTLVVEALASARPFPERGDADALARRLGTSGSRN